MPTELNLPTVGPLPNASKGDDEYTREDIARRVQLTMRSGAVSYAVPLLGHGPHVVLVLSEVAWPIGMECSLTAKSEHHRATTETARFSCPEGAVIASYDATLDGARRHLVFIRSVTSLAHFFLGFDRGSDPGRFICFAVPEEIVGILDDTGHAYYLTDSKHRTVFISQAEVMITGRKEEETLGRNREKMWWNPKDRVSFLQRLESSPDVGQRGPKQTETVRWMKLVPEKAPEPRWLTTTSVWHTGKDGRFLGDGGVYNDTTVIRSQQERLDRAEAASSLVMVFSHQLKSPLVNIKILAEDIINGSIPQDQVRRTCRSIEGLAQSSLHLYGRLKLLSEILSSPDREVKTAMSWVDIRSLLNRVCEETASYAEFTALRIHFDPAPFKDILVFGDETLLHQVFVCLLDNAIKYSTRGSTIAATGLCSGDYLHVMVKNHGILLHKQQVREIFERGHRTPEAQRVAEGTGLGLWLAKRILDAHSARIEAIGTDPDGITTFDVMFRNDPNSLRRKA